MRDVASTLRVNVLTAREAARELARQVAPLPASAPIRLLARQLEVQLMLAVELSCTCDSLAELYDREQRERAHSGEESHGHTP